MTACDIHVLSRFVDGELPPPRFREVAEHVRDCRDCQRELHRLRHMNHVLWSWGSRRETIPAATEMRVQRSVERRRRLRPLFALSRMTPAAVGSSIAALLILVSVNLTPMYQNAWQRPTRPTSTAPFIRHQSAQLRFNRGTSAVLANRAVAQQTRLSRHAPALDVQ